MAFKFVAVLCLVTLAAAGDYEYNKPTNNSFDIRSNDNQQQNVAPVANNNVTQNAEPRQSYNNDNNIQGNSTNDDNQSVNTPIVAPAGNDVDSSYAPSDNSEPAKYEYGYDVNVATTGDIKSHTESRDGDYIRGVYSVVDPDGFKRIVTYTVDGANGYKAVVHREPIAIKLATTVVSFKSADIVVPADSSASAVVKSSQEVASNVTAEVKDSYSSPPAQDGKGPYA